MLFAGISKYCSICSSSKTYISKYGYEQWRKINDRYVCTRCYFREMINPRSHKFKKKRLFLTSAPRKHVCKRCGNRIGDFYINSLGRTSMTRRTVIHHERYNEQDVLAGSQELCASCHTKAVWTTDRKRAHSIAIKKLWRKGLYLHRGTN